jgi:hypothetical protein
MWHPSMFGFNQTGGDNRPLDPLLQRHFNTSDETDSWWYVSNFFCHFFSIPILEACVDTYIS